MILFLFEHELNELNELTWVQVPHIILTSTKIKGTMTRNDFIHHAAIALYSRDNSDEKIIAEYAEKLANEVAKIAPFDREYIGRTPIKITNH